MAPSWLAGEGRGPEAWGCLVSNPSCLPFLRNDTNPGPGRQDGEWGCWRKSQRPILPLTLSRPRAQKWPASHVCSGTWTDRKVSAGSLPTRLLQSWMCGLEMSPCLLEPQLFLLYKDLVIPVGQVVGEKASFMGCLALFSRQSKSPSNCRIIIPLSPPCFLHPTLWSPPTST